MLIRTSAGQSILTASSDVARRREIIGRLATDPVVQEAVRREPGASAASVVARLLRHLSDMEDGAAPFVIQAGGGRLLVRVASRDEIIGGAGGEDDPSGKVIALVVAAYSPQRSQGLRLDEHGRALDGGARPERAYVVVVNLQRESATGNSAADLAGQVVETLLAARLADRGGAR